MKKMYVAFSHQLTDAQKRDAAVSLNVETFVYPSADIQKLISNIPSDMKPHEVREIAVSAVLEALTEKCDYFFIAGQVELVHYALERIYKINFHGINGITAVNSLTERQSVETEMNGVVTKTSIFNHVRWREII
jgi:hypothetical protein